jgi:Tol biopolymer transport system component
MISADGRYVAFYSYASSLVPDDTNGDTDIFVHEIQTGITSLISVSTAGTQANIGSFDPSISADGQVVAFTSEASNLVPGDGNGLPDVFVRDIQTGITSRVSVSTAGTEGSFPDFNPAISGNGRYVAFESESFNLVSGDTNNEIDIFVHDTQTGITSRVSVSTAGTQANGGSFHPAFSGDGRYVAFHSYASSLVPGDGNDATDIFVRGIQTGITSRVSVSAAGTEGNGFSATPAVSADGRYVVFESDSDNLVAGSIPSSTSQIYRAPLW